MAAASSSLKLKGTVIGRVTNGRVQVKDFRPFDSNGPVFTGCKLKRPSLGVTVCQGRNVGYRVADGRFNTNIRGSGISISAVGRGTVMLDGPASKASPTASCRWTTSPTSRSPTSRQR